MGMNTVSDRPSVGVHVVTGATAGLGLETAAGLAEQGLHVVIAGRGSERLAAARASILERCPGASLDVIAVDLASLDSVRAAAAQLRERYTSIEVLVNNAGVMYTPLERTAEGFELQFGVNCLGHFEWTKLLMPLLLADDGARVVNVASHAHRANGIDLADPNWERRPYDKFVAYAAAKTANILFTVGLEQRFAGCGVHAFAVHPGTVNTSLGRYMSRDDMRHLKSLVAARAGVEIGATPPPIVYASVRDGARTSVWAATTADLVDRGGCILPIVSLCRRRRMLPTQLLLTSFGRCPSSCVVRGVHSEAGMPEVARGARGSAGLVNAFVERWSPTEVLPTILPSGMRSVTVNAPVDASRCRRSADCLTRFGDVAYLAR